VQPATQEILVTTVLVVPEVLRAVRVTKAQQVILVIPVITEQAVLVVPVEVPEIKVPMATQEMLVQMV
jgi:hypothetical protein